MTSINYIKPSSKEKEKLNLPQWMGILTMGELIEISKDEIDYILDFSKVDKVNKKDILYKKMLDSYTESLDSFEIINYFKNVDNLYLIDFIQNYLFKNSNKKNIKKLWNEILNEIVFLDNNHNNILLFLITDLKIKNVWFWDRYEDKPKQFLNKYSKNIEVNWKTYYKVSSDYYAEYSFENNLDWEVIQIWKIENNKFIWCHYNDLSNNNEINIFWEDNLDLILSLSHTPKIKKFLEEWLLMRITDIPLKSQTQLFKFLINSDEYIIDNYKKIIAKNWWIHNEIQQAFFAVSEDKEMSDIILKIADSDISEIDKKNIFDKYNYLVDTIFEEINNQFWHLEWEEKKEIFQIVVKELNFLFKDIGTILDDYDLQWLKNINNILENTKKDFIKSWVIFKSLKEKNINTLDDLSDIGIKYEKVNSLSLSESRKKEILYDFRSLYEDNYDLETQWVFIDEMIDWLENSLNSDENIDFYLFFINDKPILSWYFKGIEKTWERYFWWFNWASSFEWYSIWFWALEKILDEEWKDSDVNALILSDTNWFENIFKSFLEIKYLELGFELWGTIKEWSSNYIEIKRKKSEV